MSGQTAHADTCIKQLMAHAKSLLYIPSWLDLSDACSFRKLALTLVFKKFLSCVYAQCTSEYMCLNLRTWGYNCYFYTVSIVQEIWFTQSRNAIRVIVMGLFRILDLSLDPRIYDVYRSVFRHASNWSNTRFLRSRIGLGPG